MSTSSLPRDRLTEIERILAQTAYVVAPSDSPQDPVAVHLADVPAARIGELTRMLQERPLEANDDVDALAMRLLLNDYIGAIAHLRAVARVAASLVDGAAAPVKESQRFLRVDDRRQEKHDVSDDAESSPVSEAGQ